LRSQDPEFRRVIEDVKLRAPIEEVVGERVHLVQRGRSFWGCCPFHDEKTPSFKVDPEQGNWYCFGACRRGGDVLGFVMETSGVTFMDALEILAARVGVTLPKRRPERSRHDDRGLAALAFADEWFQAQLGAPAGADARAYLERRGFGPNARQAFGLGYAPQGRALLDAAAAARLRVEDLERVGLARRGDDGSAYSFFRGRLIVPIRDLRGETVAFGGRRLVDDDQAGPKYVNTPETDYFHKGRLVYALDRAVDAVRRGGHLVLVEGYTDVIAAHQAGLPIVCAVLGTATTSDHAELLRRAGARRISLVFDGDEAGRQAAYRGLEGLLALESELEVVVLPRGLDPADVLGGEGGAAAFQAHLDAGLPWLDFVAHGLEGKSGRELSREVDRILGLIECLRRPVERESALRALAERSALPLGTLREQLVSLPRRKGRGPGEGLPGAVPTVGREGLAREGAPPGAGGSGAEARSGDGENQRLPLDRRLERAYEDIVGAVLVEPSLCPQVRPWVARCPTQLQELADILVALLAIWDDEDLDEMATIDVGAVLNRLGDFPARRHVVGLAKKAEDAESASQLLAGAIASLVKFERDQHARHLNARLRDLQRLRDLGDEAAGVELEAVFLQLSDLSRGAALPT